MNNFTFYVIWKDANQVEYKVGVLSHIDGSYYLKTCTNNSEPSSPYQNGFNGLPSFNPETIYKSDNSLFDFWKRRIIIHRDEDLYTVLKRTSASNRNDSFYLEEASSEDTEKIEDLFLSFDKEQEQENII